MQKIAGLAIGLLALLPLAASAQSYSGMYGNQQQMYWCNNYYSYSPCSSGGNYGYDQNYQLYWCNLAGQAGYYSYSPCVQQYYQPQYYYYYPYQYYYPSYSNYNYNGYGYDYGYSGGYGNYNYNGW